MKALKINKTDVIVLRLIRYRDKTNGNTYNIYSTESFILRKGKRLYFSDLLPDFGKTFFYSYSDVMSIAKEFLNKYTTMNIVYCSDFPNIVCCENYVNYRTFKALQK